VIVLAIVCAHFGHYHSKGGKDDGHQVRISPRLSFLVWEVSVASRLHVTTGLCRLLTPLFVFVPSLGDRAVFTLGLQNWIAYLFAMFVALLTLPIEVSSIFHIPFCLDLPHSYFVVTTCVPVLTAHFLIAGETT
jgi:hypothetical protein